MKKRLWDFLSFFSIFVPFTHRTRTGREQWKVKSRIRLKMGSLLLGYILWTKGRKEDIFQSPTLPASFNEGNAC